MCAEAQIDVLLAGELVVVLIERIVQALVQVVRVEQDDRLAELHRVLDGRYVAAYLRVLLIGAERRAEDELQVVLGHSDHVDEIALDEIDGARVLREEEQVAVRRLDVFTFFPIILSK